VAVASAVLAAPGILRFAHAAEYRWRLGHVAPSNTPLHQRLIEAAESISQRSDGQMEFSVIGEGKAGIQSGLLAQVRNGGIEMTVATCSQLVPTINLCTIPLIGFAFSNYAKLWPAMDGELGRTIRSQFPVQAGMEVLDIVWDFGFRHITTSTHQLRIARDVAGLKIRTQMDSAEMEMFRALGVVPVAITLPYLRTALEHHQIDGQEGLLPIIEFARLNEVQSYCALTHHIWDGLWLCINPSAWRSLPERLRHIVANTIDSAGRHQREDSRRMEEQMRTSLTSRGMKFNEVDVASFRETLHRQGYYDSVKSRVGERVWQIVQSVTEIAT
jgi:tripartite ATP-independent transporter DctP family solute receptor